MNEPKTKTGRGLSALLTDATPSAPSLQFILLSDICLSAQNPRKTVDDTELNELADSIRKLGVIQPVTIRPLKPVKSNPHQAKYEMVCGERRYLAADIAGLTSIPASVRELTDQEAMEIMITENLQRKDVHPLEEADAFSFMINKMGYELADIGAKVGKNEPFVIRRLQLIKLIKELKAVFIKNELSIGHAELLSRINDVHQLMWFKDDFSSNHNPGQGTIASLRNWLKNRTEHQLKDAPFKTDAPYEGLQFISPRCTVCPQNSAFNNTLFPDTADKAICHDAHCYQAKCNVDFDERLKAAIDDPEVVLINDSYGDDKFEKKLISDGHLVLSGWDSFEKVNKPDKSSYLYKGKNADEHKTLYAAAIEAWKEKLQKCKKGFKIAGSERGSFVNILIKDKKLNSQISSNDPAAARKTFVADVEDKRKRGRELDGEKIMKLQVAHIKDLPFIKEPDQNLDKLTAVESNALLCLAWSKAGYDSRGIIRKLLDMKSNYGDVFEDYEKLLNAPEYIKAYIIRSAVFHTFNGIYPASLNGAVTAALTKDWAFAEFEKINTDQAGVRERREAKLDQKIKDFDKNLLTEKSESKK